MKMWTIPHVINPQNFLTPTLAHVLTPAIHQSFRQALPNIHGSSGFRNRYADVGCNSLYLPDKAS